MNDGASSVRDRSGLGVNTETIKQVKTELGLPESVSTDIEGLRQVYAAWCKNMTFDNVRKFVSLRSGDKRLAGGDAEDYFAHWLEHRSGGTCWPSSNALYILIASYGFDARRVAGAMYDLPVKNHGSVKVRIDGVDWLADSSMLLVEPVRLTGELITRTEGLVRVEVEPHEAGYLIWTDFPPMPEFIPCRLRQDPVDLEFYLERYERSRAMSPFNERLYLRKVTPAGLVVILGKTLFRRVGVELKVQELNAEELRAAMHEIGGISEAFIARWADAGGLEASLNPSGPAPEFPDAGLRPSRRSAG